MPFKIESIGAHDNGFVLYLKDGRSLVATSLEQASLLIGEVPSYSSTIYNRGHDVNDLPKVRTLAMQGKKIEAIKLLRECFSPCLGLREARDLVEQLCF